MTDVFDTKILCKRCEEEMRSTIVSRNGLELRAVKCPACSDVIIHPADLNGMEHFRDLKDKKFNVKLRMVGNSHTISIPKEIVDFMSERHREMKREMDDIVRLWFDDLDTLKVSFWDGDEDDDEGDGEVEESDGETGLDESQGDVKRSVRNYGRGNVDVVEEQTLSDGGRHVKKIRIRKIRRNHY